jgi:predicted enzyme related to lactoylglutathione lyase
MINYFSPFNLQWYVQKNAINWFEILWQISKSTKFYETIFGMQLIQWICQFKMRMFPTDDQLGTSGADISARNFTSRPPMAWYT